jgi:hypothetical protein
MTNWAGIVMIENSVWSRWEDGKNVYVRFVVFGFSVYSGRYTLSLDPFNMTLLLLCWLWSVLVVLRDRLELPCVDPVAVPTVARQPGVDVEVSSAPRDGVRRHHVARQACYEGGVGCHCSHSHVILFVYCLFILFIE